MQPYPARRRTKKIFKPSYSTSEGDPSKAKTECTPNPAPTAPDENETKVAPQDLLSILRPPQPSDLFTGRAKELEYLSSYFDTASEVQLAVQGVPGCGKTQLALQLAQVAALNRHVFYVDTSSSMFTWHEPPEKLGFPKDTGARQKHTPFTFGISPFNHRSLRIGLLIFDGLSSPQSERASMFKDSLLEASGLPGLSVLYILDRCRSENRFKLQVYSLTIGLDTEDAVGLLFKSTGSQRVEFTQAESRIANKIAEDFGHLTSAVAQVGIAVRNAGLALHMDRLLSAERHHWIKTVVTALGSPWRSSYDGLTKSDQTLLKALVFLPPLGSELLDEILRRAQAKAKEYHPLCSTHTDMQQIKREVHDLPFFCVSPIFEGPKPALRISQLQRLFMLPSKNKDLRPSSYTWAKMLIADRSSAEAFVVYLLAASVPSGPGVSNLDFMSNLKPLIDKMMVWHPDACTPHYIAFSAVYKAFGRWGDAMRLQERALEMAKLKLGDQHDDTISTTTCLAKTYCQVGRWGDARRLQLVLLGHLETIMGDTHLDVLSMSHDLALTLSRLGRWEDAETLLARVCEGRKKLLGELHPETMAAMQSVASSYAGQLRWQEAIELHNKVLETRKHVLGAAHRDTLSSMHSLTTLHQEKGEPTWGTEQSAIRVYNLRRQTLGQRHPDTLSSAFILALEYHEQGKLELAITWASSTLSGRKSRLGRDHVDTIQTMHTLSSWYSECHRLSHATKILVKILGSCRLVYGNSHPQTLSCMGTLMQMYRKQRLPGRAEGLHLELLEARRRLHGENAPIYLSTLLDLATGYFNQCRWREASALYKAALKIKNQDIELNSDDKEITKIQQQLDLTLFALSSGVFVIAESVAAESVVAHFTEKAGLKDYSTELREAPNVPTEPIAHGGFSNIYRVTLQDGDELAIKCLRKTDSGYKQVKQTIRELSTWSELQHKCVAELLGLALFQDQLAMVSTWNKKGNVIQYIEQEPCIDRYELCQQLVTAVVYLHKLDVVHGDLKGANILVSDDGTLQLTDFGLAVMHDATVQLSKSTSQIGGGTLRWMAPELVFGNEAEGDLTDQTNRSMNEALTRAKEDQDENEVAPSLCRETDIYALGMTMLEILTGKRPFNEIEKDTLVIVALSKGKRPQYPRKVLNQSPRGAPFWDILQKCWSESPADRPTANEVIRSYSADVSPRR
ncbi:hypothetical protein BDV93DRAFT_608934 [Ceratobasidium sp. AG-I]|nr:hypothetical protein BDV93DRAFT_608934 [Ceratobasidium sp. AG-I]